jgi:hypothetical protein
MDTKYEFVVTRYWSLIFVLILNPQFLFTHRHNNRLMKVVGKIKPEAVFKSGDRKRFYCVASQFSQNSQGFLIYCSSLTIFPLKYTRQCQARGPNWRWTGRSLRAGRSEIGVYFPVATSNLIFFTTTSGSQSSPHSVDCDRKGDFFRLSNAPVKNPWSHVSTSHYVFFLIASLSNRGVLPSFYVT